MITLCEGQGVPGKANTGPFSFSKLFGRPHGEHLFPPPPWVRKSRGGACQGRPVSGPGWMAEGPTASRGRATDSGGEAEEQNGQGFNVKMYTTERYCTEKILINRV